MVCKHCGLPMLKTVDGSPAGFIHTNGWYSCRQAARFAGKRDDDIPFDQFAAPEEVTSK